MLYLSFHSSALRIVSVIFSKYQYTTQSILHLAVRTLNSDPQSDPDYPCRKESLT